MLKKGGVTGIQLLCNYKWWEESAGSRVWIISSNVFFRAIEKLDMQPAIPNSFMPYKQDIKKNI